MNGDNFIKEIGRSYLISAFLPSALFVALAVILFRSFVPDWFRNEFEPDSFLAKNSWTLLLIVTLWIAFFLFSSVDWIVKLFEGYYIPKFLSVRMVETKQKLHKKRLSIYNRVAPIVRKEEPDRTFREFNLYRQLYPKALAELQNVEMASPIDPGILLPTRLGNVLRASEVYANERYSMIGVTIWPRLYPVLPRQFIADMDEKYSQMMFLLNSAFLTFSIAIISFVIGMIGWIILMTGWIRLPGGWRVELAGVLSNFEFIQPGEYMVLAVLFGLFGYAMYNAAVNTAQDYTLFIRTGFDLYRTDLIRQLKFEIPKNFDGEKELWLSLSELYSSGERLALQPLTFPDYKLPEKKEQQ